MVTAIKLENNTSIHMDTQRDIEICCIIEKVLQKSNEVMLQLKDPLEQNSAKEKAEKAHKELLQMKMAGRTVEQIRARSEEHINILANISKCDPSQREPAKSLLTSMHEKIASALPSSITPEKAKTTVQVGLSLGVGAVAGQTAGRIYKNHVAKAHGTAFEKSIQADQVSAEAKKNKLGAKGVKEKARTKYRHAQSSYETFKTNCSKMKQFSYHLLDSSEKGQITSLPKRRENASNAKKTYKAALQAENVAKAVADQAAKAATEATQEAVKAGARAANKVVPEVIKYGTGALVTGAVFLATRVAAAPLNWALNSTELGNADLPMPEEPAKPRVNQSAPSAPEKDRVATSDRLNGLGW